MAVRFIHGFENRQYDRYQSADTLANVIVSSSPTPHSGSLCMKGDCNLSAAANWSQDNGLGTGAVSLSVWGQSFYFQVLTLPNGPVQIADGGTSTIAVLQLNADGTLSILQGGTTLATSTSAFTADGLWHLVEWDFGFSSGNGQRVVVDFSVWASDTSLAPPAANNIRVGVVGGSASSGFVAFDDWVVWDSSLTLRSTHYKTAWLAPVSDNARGANWTGGAAGTTNLWQAVDNIPPVGLPLASETNTSQIKNAAKDSTGNYDANCTDYTTAGIGASDTIDAVQAQCVNGWGTSGTFLNGSVSIASNPAQADKLFAFGFNAAGVAGTYPTTLSGGGGGNGWFSNSLGAVTTSPAVTKGTQPVCRVGRRTASKTNEVYVAQMGIAVLYTPAVVAAAAGPKPTVVSAAVMRAATR